MCELFPACHTQQIGGERGQYRNPNTLTNRLEDDELIDDDVMREGGVSSTGVKDPKNRLYPTFSDPLRVQQWVRVLRILYELQMSGD
jgi:hypothetical protein